MKDESSRTASLETEIVQRSSKISKDKVDSSSKSSIDLKSYFWELLADYLLVEWSEYELSGMNESSTWYSISLSLSRMKKIKGERRINDGKSI